MKLRIRAFALSTGAVLGLAIFLVTILFLIANYNGDMLLNLRAVLFGYSITFAGSLIGLVWGLIYGIIGGGLFALLYNYFQKRFPARS